MRRTNPGPRRGGFTLIELMIVITIILTLMALSASAVLKVMNVQAINNTQTTLNKVQSLVNRQWSAAKDQAYKETIPANVASWIQTYLAGTDANATGRVRVIYVKLRMRQIFPMSFNEVFNIGVPVGYPLLPLPGYTTYLAQVGISSSLTTYPNNFESAACLLMALERAQSGGGSDSADLGGGGSSAAFGLANGQSIRALVDAWGRPLFFSRFPAGSTVLNPLGAQVGNNDPGDPQGYLNSPVWPAGMRGVFSALANQPLAPSSNPPLSYKLAPMVASCGQDNWMKTGVPTINPISFALTTPSSAALFSNP